MKLNYQRGEPAPGRARGYDINAYSGFRVFIAHIIFRFYFVAHELRLPPKEIHRRIAKLSWLCAWHIRGDTYSKAGKPKEVS
jgi:hypothetical protein